MTKLIYITLLALLIIGGSALLFNLLERGLETDLDSAPPTISGEIYELSEDRVLVAEDLMGPEPYDGDIDRLRGQAFSLTLTEQTEITDFQGDRLTNQDLTLGDQVEVWVSGPIMESYPAQAEADRIQRLEPAERRPVNDHLPVDTVRYENPELGVALSHPPQAGTREEAGRVKVTLVGPDSHPTEITDGFTFFVHLESLTDSTLAEVAEAEFAEQTEILEPITPPEPFEIRDQAGYRFVIEGGLGNEHTYLIFELENQAVVTSYFIADPADRGYQADIDRLLNSVAVIE